MREYWGAVIPQSSIVHFWGIQEPSDLYSVAVLPDSVILLEVLQVLVGGQNELRILDVFQELPNISIHEGPRVLHIPRILISVINRAEGGLILGDRLEEGTTLIRATHQLQHF